MAQAKTVKMCDMSIAVATKVFEMLNNGKLQAKFINARYFIVTDVEPKDLTYPEGWYYAKGSFRNKHMSTTGMYGEAYMQTSDGTLWIEKVNYCTLD